MAIDAITRVFDGFTGSPTETLVLLALADRANGEWSCWPSVADIVRRTNLSRQSVKSVLARLEERGVIVRDRFGGMKGSHGGRPTNRYTILKSSLDDRTAADPSDRTAAGPSASSRDTSEHPNGQLGDSQGLGAGPEPKTLNPHGINGDSSFVEHDDNAPFDDLTKSRAPRDSIARLLDIPDSHRVKVSADA